MFRSRMRKASKKIGTSRINTAAAYFNAFMYLNDQNLYPLQIFLRDILISNKVDASMIPFPTSPQRGRKRSWTAHRSADRPQ